MLYSTSQGYQYTQPVRNPTNKNLYLPLEIDTEYTTQSEFIDADGNYGDRLENKKISAQVRSIDKKQGKIYEYIDVLDVSRHTIAKYSFIGWDYLKELGYDVIEINLAPDENPLNLPFLQVDIYAFFAVAELYRIFQKKYLEDIDKVVLYGSKTRGITQGRRLRTYTILNGTYYDYIEMPWYILFNGIKFRIRICIYDTCAVHGMINYHQFCQNSNIKLEYKDNFTSDEKSKMLDMYKDRPIDFDNYALGDLYNYKALISNAENFKKIYQAIGLKTYYRQPKLTIGATIAQLLESAINKQFNYTKNDRKYINQFCKYASADYLKKLSNTASLNAKVDGGRCRNNRPLDTYIKGSLCDIDISGCYGEGLRVQTYPIGIPIILSYRLDTHRNKYLSLRDFLSEYGDNLVPGLWQARVSLKPNYQLKYKQDYITSWIPPKDITNMSTDTDYYSTDQWWELDNVGTIKILYQSVENGLITHDFIQWLEHVVSEKQRKELLDNLEVTTAMWYPKYEEVDSVNKLIEAHKNHKGLNTTVIKHTKNNIEVIITERECHAWYGVNLGDLLINNLLKERKKHPKKTPLNTLYKLAINTTYGDMVSPYFIVGNVVVGNNITARARSLAWCMEKGLNGFESITDGCTFDLNKVTYPLSKRSINGFNSTSIYKDRGKKHLKLLALGANSEYKVKKWLLNKDKSITIDNGVDSIIIEREDAQLLVSKLAMEHLKNQFPNLDVLHQNTTDVSGKNRIGQFEFEVKGFFDKGTFHGSANYCLWDGDRPYPKMRSYSKKEHNIYELEDDLVLVGKGNSSKKFLTSLINPNNVPRSKVYTKVRILKIKDYRNNYSKYQDSNLFPGCTIEQGALLREFSISQFTFNNYDQYKSWKLEYAKLLRKYGQSYEMFFLNKDGSLNYQLMIETIENCIYQGDNNFIGRKGKILINQIENDKEHPSLKGLEKTRKMIDWYQGIYNNNYLY